MNSHSRIILLIACGLLLVASIDAPTQAVSEMVHCGAHFLAALSPDGKVAASFPFQSDERTNWHYVPKPRQGLSLSRMSPAQRRLAFALVSTALSNQGLQQANQIMYLEKILYDLEGKNPSRDPVAYFISIFGRPSSSAVWGWRLEGHHLSLNITVGNGRVMSTTPAFFGSNPAIVKDGPHRGLQVLGEEQELGRKLIQLLDIQRRNRAIISGEAPVDIVTGSSRQVDLGSPSGIPFRELRKEQQKVLLDLLDIYAKRFRPELALKTSEGLRQSQLGELHFAWAGGLEPGEPHYYRIQSDSFVVEYDNTQDDANHIHTVWRDIRNDFGRDLLREHYHQSH